MKEDKCPLSDEENNELMSHLIAICNLAEKVWERSKNDKPCYFGLSIGDNCYSINLKKTKPFGGIDEYIEVTKE